MVAYVPGGRERWEIHAIRQYLTSVLGSDGVDGDERTRIKGEKGTLPNGTYLSENKDIFQSVRMASDNDKLARFPRLLIHMPTLQGRLNSKPAKCATVTT